MCADQTAVVRVAEDDGWIVALVAEAMRVQVAISWDDFEFFLSRGSWIGTTSAPMLHVS